MTHGQVIQYSGDQTCRICAKESKNCGTIYDASCLVLILVVHVDLTVIYIYISNLLQKIRIWEKCFVWKIVRTTVSLCQSIQNPWKVDGIFFYSQTRNNHELGRQVQIHIRSVSTKALRIYEETLIFKLHDKQNS